jgi:3-oxoacyl-[acyl-carrier-protein] synthase-3
MYSRIIGTGSYLPEKIVTNDDLARIVDTSDEWIRTRSGIRSRHVAADGQLASDLALPAAQRAMEAAGVTGAQIDLIIVATTTPDIIFPSTACILQAKLGIAGCPAFDVQAVCSGFVYGLTIADLFIKAGQAKHVLLIGTEVYSRILDWTDRGTCVLFGDGAGAVLLAPDDDPKRGILSTHLYADGNYTDALYQPAGGSREPPSEKTVAEKRHYVKMNGREVYKHAVRNMASAAKTALEANALTPSDVAWVIAHQANLRIIEGVAERVAIPMDRFYINVDRYGNTSSASVPTALDEACENGKLKSGDLLLFSALGGGLAWASAAVRW